jgi:hypothetical protein
MAAVTAAAQPKLATRSLLIPAGIACGTSIWGIYGILEYVFYTIRRVRSENRSCLRSLLSTKRRPLKVWDAPSHFSVGFVE